MSRGLGDVYKRQILGEGRPIYHIERKIEESGNNFNDGSHIIYVNGNCRYDQTALSRLMHDFFCTRASDMHYRQLQERVKYLKETEEGVQTMCKIINDLSNLAFAQGEAKGEARGEAKATLNIAQNMKKSGKFSDEAIVLATNLTLAQVKAIRV